MGTGTENKNISLTAVRNSKAVDPDKLPKYIRRQYDALETDLERATFFGFGNTSRPNYDTPSYNLSKNETKIGPFINYFSSSIVYERHPCHYGFCGSGC